MVTVNCPPERREEIREWLAAKNAEMFGDVEREKSGVLHQGALEVTDTESGLQVDFDGIYYSRGHFIQSELISLIREFNATFPFAEMSGPCWFDIGHDSTFKLNILSKAGESETHFQEYYTCRVCWEDFTDVSQAFWIDGESHDCVCSPECACKAAMGEADDSVMEMVFEDFFRRLPSYADRVLTKETIAPLTDMLDDEQENNYIGLDEEVIRSAKALLLEYGRKLEKEDSLQSP